MRRGPKGRALTHDERRNRSKHYQGIIDDWKTTQQLAGPGKLRDAIETDIRDMEAWITTLKGPVDNELGPARRKGSQTNL